MDARQHRFVFLAAVETVFQMGRPDFLSIAVLLPPLAMLGTHQAAREVIELAKNPAWRAQNIKPIPRDKRQVIDTITLFYFPIGYAAAILLVFAARGARALNERRRGTVMVSYPGRQVRVPKGLSVLEASLRHNVPHASVCGGRARCSTCRVKIVSDRSTLPKPSGREAFVLARVGAGKDASIRLACQLRPQTDIAVIPVMPPNVGADFVRSRQRINVGEEHFLVSMFVDMRGSTSLSEGRLPFDVVFLINRFVETVSRRDHRRRRRAQPVRRRRRAGVVRSYHRSGDGLPAGVAGRGARRVERRPPEPPVRDRSQRARSIRHRHPCRRGHHRRHRLSRPHGVHGVGRTR